MKVICILQNAWGNDRLPLIFTPNPHNKSAKTIRNKLLEPDDIMHFCNTTGTVTATASGKAPIDNDHFKRVLRRIEKGQYDFILVCGKQAALAVQNHLKDVHDFCITILHIPHPASRSLSNVQLQDIKEIITLMRKLKTQPHENQI